ncbi:mitochondrial carrier [Xylona heveae TC161]|uniref:Mitochondrial carrier n=1 Tax=Xylona heveae (strain CBS 132557 / TC161) TaxID=1328760 RepID=A0A165G367_XYLHT|nr:mitochondrial carrier [Xylona heveae TC161]KZF21686.1 mitochondrial carrier [Xylona heveae TC161]
MAYIYNSQLDAFSLYHIIQEAPEPSTSAAGPAAALPALGHAIAGSVGSGLSNVAIYPISLITTRLQVQRQFRKDRSTADPDEYKDVVDAAQKIFAQEGGISAFYQGVLQDTSKTVVDAFLFFLAYTFLRQQRKTARAGVVAPGVGQLQSKTLPVLDELGIGVLAGAFSKLVTTPISNIVTRKQTAAMIAARSSTATASQSLSVKDIALQIREEKGISGFWSGYSASLILTLNPSITFFLYETFKRTLLPRSQRDKPSARATFLLAAISKAMASCVTYPFSLAKARAQLSSGNADDEESELETRTAPTSTAETGTGTATNIGTGAGADPLAAASLPPSSASSSKQPSDASTRKRRLNLKNFKFRVTVLSLILRIIRTEGPTALYEGLAGELLRGFFSHGITMLVKESVHKFIVQLYFAILRVLDTQHPTLSLSGWRTSLSPSGSRYPSSASSAAAEAATAAKSSAQALAYSATQQTRAGVSALWDKSQQAAREAMDSANDAVEFVTDYIGDNGDDDGGSTSGGNGSAGGGGGGNGRG